ncbi:MAG: cytochrome P460 family protein [Planctomycetales bacterium]
MNINSVRHSRLLGVSSLVLILVGGVWFSSAIQDARSQTRAEPRAATRPAAAKSREPQYNAEGELKRPTDFETWVFVGANMGLEYREADAPEPLADKDRDTKAKIGNFHNVYITPEAYEHYARTGKFPEKTMLALDIYKAETGEPKGVVAEGLFPGKQTGLAVAVKNSARPDGSKTDWAYYEFSADQEAARAFPDKACYDCHLQHASDDLVWVQFYPTLRKLRDARQPRADK